MMYIAALNQYGSPEELVGFVYNVGGTLNFILPFSTLLKELIFGKSEGVPEIYPQLGITSTLFLQQVTVHFVFVLLIGVAHGILNVIRITSNGASSRINHHM